MQSIDIFISFPDRLREIAEQVASECHKRGYSTYVFSTRSTPPNSELFATHIAVVSGAPRNIHHIADLLCCSKIVFALTDQKSDGSGGTDDDDDDDDDDASPGLEPIRLSTGVYNELLFAQMVSLLQWRTPRLHDISMNAFDPRIRRRSLRQEFPTVRRRLNLFSLPSLILLNSVLFASHAYLYFSAEDGSALWLAVQLFGLCGAVWARQVVKQHLRVATLGGPLDDLAPTRVHMHRKYQFLALPFDDFLAAADDAILFFKMSAVFLILATMPLFTAIAIYCMYDFPVPYTRPILTLGAAIVYLGTFASLLLRSQVTSRSVVIRFADYWSSSPEDLPETTRAKSE